MKKQCNHCYDIGHLKKDCKAEKVQWLEYIEKLRRSGRFEDQMFGNWIEILKEESEKPTKPPGEKQDLRRYLSDPDALKNRLASYLEGKERGRQQNQNASRQRSDRNQSSNNSRGADNGDSRERDNRSNNNRRNNNYRSNNRSNGRGQNNWRRGDNRRGSPDGRKRHQNDTRDYDHKKDRRT